MEKMNRNRKMKSITNKKARKNMRIKTKSRKKSYMETILQKTMSGS